MSCCRSKNADSAASEENGQKAMTSPPGVSGGASAGATSTGLAPTGSRPMTDGPSSAGLPLFVANYDYEARTDEDLGFNKGDDLYIIDNSQGNWWKARSKLSGREGYIPNNYVAPAKTLDAHE